MDETLFRWRVAAPGGRWRGRDAMTSHPPVFPTAIRQPLPPVLGRADHPWLAAAEQGCSALPQDREIKSKGDRRPERMMRGSHYSR